MDDAPDRAPNLRARRKRRVGAAMGGDSKFWVFFGGIWLLVGLGFAVGGLGALLSGAPTEFDEPVLLWIFLPVGSFSPRSAATSCAARL